MRADGPRRLRGLERQARSWLALWGLPGGDLKIEWSSRLHRSLGRAVPRRSLVRLSPLLLDAPRQTVLEVLCHETAHLAVPLLHRGSPRPHGPEWAGLVRLAGYPPRVRMTFEHDVPTPASARMPAAERRPEAAGRLYVHTCPVCRLRRLARRRVTRWRCAACVAAGLDGRLTIVRAPARPP
jgi:predicted SprT family Zn-dependent metalloprotease